MRLFAHNMNDFNHPTHIKLQDNMNCFGDLKQHSRQWSPYEVNEGTVAAVAGEDCVVIAADTRVSRG
jgi:20S proteasome alpha/beta subunit